MMNSFARTLFACLLCALGNSALAQYKISGTVIDGTDNLPLSGASVFLQAVNDSTRAGMATDSAGAFIFDNLANGTYYLKITYIGNSTYEKTVKLQYASEELGIIKMGADVKQLKDVVVETMQSRGMQKGDTIQYNADAFKTQPDATAEDLVNKMPGISSKDGTVKAHGETVQKVTVDGKEFFGDDATLALKTIPAEVIDKVQVYDRMSEQSQFTGFDDGNSEKTINLTTKSGKSNGIFGKVYGGYGYLDKYLAGGNFNWFKGARRLSVIELSNNVNQQNFSTQDLSGALGGGGSTRGRGGNRGGSGDMNNFLVGQNGGINTTHSVGLNYSDMWGKKINVTGSYFFNYLKNETENTLQRQYFLSDALGQLYKENSTGSNENFNHRLSMRLEYVIDSANSLVINPRFNFQNNLGNSQLTGSYFQNDTSLLSRTASNSDASSTAYNFSGTALYRHRFKKPSRTLSANFGFTYNNKNAVSNLFYNNEYVTVTDSTDSDVDQTSSSLGSGYNINGNLSYTEPAGKKGMLQFTYSPSYNFNNSDAATRLRDTTTQEFSLLDSALSSRYENTSVVQRGGVSYRFRDTTYNIMIGVNYQNVMLMGSEFFPNNSNVNKVFNNILPSLMFNYRFKKTGNLRVFYRTSTNVPSTAQLQSVINNSNPLLLSTGNPDLKQEYNHSVMVRLGYVDNKTMQSIFVFVNGTYTQNRIGSSAIIATNDTLLGNEVLLRKGSQLTRPVNLQGYWTSKNFVTYSVPVSKIKSNLNLNVGFNYTRAPALINQQLNVANTYSLNAGFVLGSSISEKVDFTISYSAGYNIVNNSIQAQSNNNYLNQISGAKINLLPWKGLVLSADFTHTYYKGFRGSDLDQSYFLLNAGIGYKFLKDKSLEVKLVGFDLLNQNKTVARNVTETYVEDTQTKALTRYFMLNITYTFKKFKLGGGKM